VISEGNKENMSLVRQEFLMIVRPGTGSNGGLRLRDDDNAKKHFGDNVGRYMSGMRLLSSFVLDRQVLSFYIFCKEKGFFVSKNKS
jgi:hypothetical protein